MNGYNNQQWQQPQGYEDNQPQTFFDQLQQHDSQPQQPYQNHQMYQNQPYQQAYPQSYPRPQVEVVIPSRQAQYSNYAESPAQSMYQQRQYNQPYQTQQFQSQPMYQYSMQLDGIANGDHVAQPPLPQPQPQPPQMPLQTMQNGIHNHVPEVKAESPEVEEESEHNYAQILLVLADEYMANAEKVEKDSEEYFKLISFALGCIESVLKNYQLPPLKTAQISLTYARLLHEHTENYDEAEKATSKAIEICEQNNYLDLKYALTLLSVRLLYETKPKAALKFLLAQIEEMETYKHVAWLYLFYYEAAILNLKNQTRDLHHAISQLEKLEQLAARYHDKAIVSFAALTAALVHLQTSHADAVSSAQQAIARSRSGQLDPIVASLPQLRITTEFVDLCCSMRACSPAEADQKRKRMQEVWSEVEDHAAWNPPGTFYVPIQSSSLRESPLQSGGLIAKHNGGHALPFSWFTRSESEQLCFLFCTTSKANKNSSDSFRSEAFCHEGLRLLRMDRPGSAAVDRDILECRFLIELAFLLCMRSEWSQASQHCVNAVRMIKIRRDAYPKPMVAACQYLNGVIAQGTGQLDKALKAYEHPILDPRQYLRQTESSQTTTSSPAQQPLSILRAPDLSTTILHNLSILSLINRLFIIDSPTHPQHANRDSMLVLLSTFAISTTSPILDRNITTACTLAHSLLTNSGIWVSKERLIKALNEAKAINNQQLTALILALMQQAFFLGATDQHAQQCVKAASVQVRSWRNATWLHVMDGVWAEALGYLGRLEEMRGKEAEARRSWEGLPEGIKGGGWVDWGGEAVRKSVAKQK